LWQCSKPPQHAGGIGTEDREAAREFRPAVRREFVALPPEAQRRLDARIRALSDDPRPVGVKALQGRPERLSRLRVGRASTRQPIGRLVNSGSPVSRTAPWAAAVATTKASPLGQGMERLDPSRSQDALGSCRVEREQGTELRERGPRPRRPRAQSSREAPGA